MVGGGLSGRLSLAWSVVGSDRGSFLPGSTACVSTDHACSDRPPVFGAGSAVLTSTDHLLLDGPLVACPTAAFA